MGRFFTASAPLAIVAMHTVVIYLFLIMMLRLLSRRQLGQLNVLDLIIVILLGSAVETAMVHADTSLQAGLVSAATLMITNRVLAALFASHRRLRHIVCASPALLVHNGQYVEENLRRIGFTHDDVLEALRQREQAGIENIRFAVMEMDGEINVVLMGEGHGRDRPRGAATSPA